MTLNKTGYLFRWAYFFKDKWEQDQIQATTLCAFFWRAFVFVPLLWFLIIAIPLTIVVTLAVQAYELGWFASSLIGGVFALIIGIASLYENRHSLALDELLTPVSESVFWQGLKAVKGKFCPIIRFGEGDI